MDATAVNADCLQQPSHPFLPPLFLFPGAPERWWRGSGYSSSRWPKIAPAEPATAVTSPRAPGGCNPEQSRKQAFDATSLCSIILPWRKAHSHFWILLIFTSRSFQEFGCAVSHDMAVLKLVEQVIAYGFLNACFCLQNYEFIWRMACCLDETEGFAHD